MERNKSVSSQIPPPATTADRFPFFRLTPELRVCIYRLLYRRRSQIWLTGHLAHSCGGDRIETGLLLSCREIYREASAVLYDTNTFAVNGSAASRDILERLGTQACSYLKRLKIWSLPLDFSKLERQLVLKKAPLSSLHMNRSVWECVSTHLHDLQTIELGNFGEGFFAAISRLTSSTRLVDKERPPPLIELEIWEIASASSNSREGRFPAISQNRDETLWLPPVRSIRLIGRLTPTDSEFLKQDIYQKYTVSCFRDLDTSDMRTAYRDDSAILITLQMRPLSMYAATLPDEEVDLTEEEKFGVESWEIFQEPRFAMLDPDQSDETTSGAGAEDEEMWDDQNTDKMGTDEEVALSDD